MQVIPKAFISYSWSSEAHRERVRGWADRLLADGVQIILDQHDLKEGHDKHAFMEKMVTDPTVTHVLVVCDKMYAEKADARKAGVGTESQIISQELYSKLEQSKFVPILAELSEAGEPYLPVFMKSRIGIDFSSPELENKNWERLIRLLFGKPLFEKPAVGKPPGYITENREIPSNPAIFKFATFKHAFLQGKPALQIYRQDFLDAFFQYADGIRIRAQPDLGQFPQKVLEDCGKLTSVRDVLADWVLLEARCANVQEFEENLLTMLEKLLELRSRPADVTTWDDVWFEAHRLFAYESFLYVVAGLLKTGAFGTIHQVFTSSFLAPATDARQIGDHFDRFDAFYAASETLQAVLAPPGKRLYSAAGALLKKQANRPDLPFDSIMEAELLVFLMACVDEQLRWYPQTLFYLTYGKRLPFFIRAAQHKHFRKLALITGVQTGDEFRTKVREGFERLNVRQWTDFSFHANVSLLASANIDKMDTIN